MGRGVKNTEVFPAAAMDGFTGARDVSWGSARLFVPLVPYWNAHEQTMAKGYIVVPKGSGAAP